MQEPFPRNVNIALRAEENGFHLVHTVGLRRAMILLEAMRQTAKAAKRGKSRTGQVLVFPGDANSVGLVAR